MHVPPVGPVADVCGYQAGQLDAFEHNDVDNRVEHREVARWGDAEPHVGETLESAPHAEESRYEAYDDEYGQAVDVQCDEVAGNEHGTHRHENAACGEAELEAEQDGEDKRHADKRGIACHVDVFLYATQRAGHLYGSGQEYTAVELEYHGKKHGEENAHRGGQELFEIAYSGSLV